MSGLIVLKKAGQIVPEAYLKKVLEEKPSILGMMAAVKKPDGNTELRLGSSCDFTIDFITQGMEENKALDMLMFFGEKPKDHEKQINCQPFQILADSQGDPLILAMIEGSFQKFAKEGGTLSPEFYLAYSYLMPKLHDMYQLCGNDIGKLTERLSSDNFKMEMDNCIDARGVIAMLGVNGTMRVFSKNDQRAAYMWGSTTKHLGFADGRLDNGVKTVVKKADEPVAEKSEKKPFLGKPDKVGEPVVPTPAEPEPAPWKEEETKPGEPLPIAATEQSTIYMIAPPSSENSRNKLRRWYGKWLKRVPDNFSDRPAIAVSKLDYDRYSGPKEVQTNGSAPTSVPSVGPIKSLSELPVEVREKDTTPKHIPDRTAGSEAPLATPILSARAIERVEQLLQGETVKTILDANSKVILDPKALQELEKTVPNFAEQCGLDSIEDTYKWPYEILVKLCADHPEAAAVLLMNYRTALLKTFSEKKLQELNKPEQQPGKEPEAAPPEQPKKVAAAGGGFGGMFDL